MEQSRIDRINELARKAKAEGLTDAEIEERAVLRQEYLNAVMSNARAVLENTYIVDEKGNKRKLPPFPGLLCDPPPTLPWFPLPVPGLWLLSGR